MKPQFLLLISVFFLCAKEMWFIPISTPNRSSYRDLKLTEIGHFGMWRNARPSVPGHYHTAIDICRPDTSRYDFSPIYPIGEGRVISVRDDGAYAQIIISHGDSVWSVYEHVAGINVKADDLVTVETNIARYMNLRELNFYGWQFNHLHLEIMKKNPYDRDTLPGQSDLHFGTYALTCYTRKDLNDCYYDPLEFFRSHWRR